MNNKNNQSEDKRLIAARVAIGNAMKNTQIAEALARFGYDKARLKEGEKLLKAADEQFANHKMEYGDQYAATDALKESREQAKTLYMEHIKLARVVLKEMPALSEPLQLKGARKASLSGWLKQSEVFYENALKIKEAKDELAKYGVDEAALNEGKALIDQVSAALALQKEETSEAQDATEAKDQSMDALDNWISKFRAIARIALVGKSQHLEALGIVVPKRS